MKADSENQASVTAFYDMIFPSTTSDIRYAEIPKRYDYSPGQVIGDFGCGAGLFKEFFKILTTRGIRVYFVDISMEVLRSLAVNDGVWTKTRIRTDIQSQGIKSAVFDGIFCIGVLHHLPNMTMAMQEIGRVVKRGGFMVLGVYQCYSFPALLRKVYDRYSSRIFRNFVRLLVNKSISLKNFFRRGFKPISKADLEKRVSDLLDTPIVRYWPEARYEKLIKEHGFSVINKEVISSMKIFFMIKD